MPTVTLRGIDVYYERRGAGPRLLLLNGSGATLATSEKVVDVFAAQFEVVAHDQRGLGRTTVPDAQPSMADYAADAAALADHVGWSRFRVVGMSFGGMVAQELAVTWPERIERLALACTSPGGDLPSYPLHDLAAVPEEERSALGRRLLDSRFDDEWLDAHPADRALAEMIGGRDGSDKTDEQRRGETLQLAARRHHDVVERLPRITCPTLVACGRYDGIAPPANSEAIAAAVADGHLRTYEGGHAFFVQDPTAMPEVLEFLAR